jgi:hypothetical protein
VINNLLSAIVLAGLVGTFVLSPEPEPVSVASRPLPSTAPTAPTARATAAAPDIAVASPAVIASNTLNSQHPPVPLVRNPRALPATAVSPEAQRKAAEGQVSDRQVSDGRDKTAARSAIEADGYKGVTVLGKSADGTWRAKAYRGNTEVQVTVDGTGRVSSE